MHEGFIYWLQYEYFFYSKCFGCRAFFIHSIQLGSSWLLIGYIILNLILNLIESYEYHHSKVWSIFGLFLVWLGLTIMWFGFRDLGWLRMMKIRLFIQPEVTWIHTGIFKFCRDPIYRGSQLSMFGMSLLLDSWLILLYVAEMIVLQQFLIWLESRPVPTTLVNYLRLNSINPKI